MFCKKYRGDEVNHESLHEGDPFVKTGELNKKLYMKDYAVEFKIPMSFVVNTRINGSFSNNYY